MKKLLLSIVVAASAAGALAEPETARRDAPTLRREDYRVPMEEVIVIGQEPYWRKDGKPRWDRSKVDVDLKAAKEERLQLFPNYTAEERDEAMKLRDSNRNNTQPKIKVFEKKF